MERVQFLRDIDDEKKYAQSLEMAYVDAFNAITDIGNGMYRDSSKYRTGGPDTELDDRLKEVRHVLFVMGLVIRDCSDRRKRLADRAVGLPDRVLDEERS